MSAAVVRTDPAESARALRRLLGGEVYGIEQTEAHDYLGRARQLSDRELEQHFAGERTFGFAPAPGGGKGHFLAIDIDANGPVRLALLAAVIERRGLSAATIATSGSDAGRIKVIVFFKSAHSRSWLRREAESILAEARSPGWGIERSKDVTPYPLEGQGGVVRIVGINRRRDRGATGPDLSFSIHGEPRSLVDVVPHVRRSEPIPIAPAPVGPWVERKRLKGVTYRNGSKGVLRELCRLAAEALRVYDYDFARSEFELWMADVLKASPAMQGASPSGDKRASRTWQRRCERAWAWAARRNAALAGPGKLSATLTRQCGTRYTRTLAVLLTYSRRKGMTPEAFAISYREIAAHAGFADPKTAYRHVSWLAAHDKVVVLDRGTIGEHGLPTLLGIVGVNETPAQVAARAEKRPNVCERRRVIEAYARRRLERAEKAMAA